MKRFCVFSSCNSAKNINIWANIVEGSKTEVGTGDGTIGGEYEEPAGKNRGDWGNLWN